MKPLFNIQDLDKLSKEELLFECYECGKSFVARILDIKRSLGILKSTRKYCTNYCSNKCQRIYESRDKWTTVSCAQCSKEFTRLKSQLSKNMFCSKSCAATYNNLHKTTGTRRSKLEQWLEVKLKSLYPNLEILYCYKSAINSELDIYIPSLRLAFELNGIYHYEPIHGSDKLDRIQSNDNRKFQACLEREIELVIIDTSTLKYFKEQNCWKYLNVIEKIIQLKVSVR